MSRILSVLDILYRRGCGKLACLTRDVRLLACTWIIIMICWRIASTEFLELSPLNQDRPVQGGNNWLADSKPLEIPASQLFPIHLVPGSPLTRRDNSREGNNSRNSVDIICPVSWLPYSPSLILTNVTAGYAKQKSIFLIDQLQRLRKIPTCCGHWRCFGHNTITSLYRCANNNYIPS